MKNKISRKLYSLKICSLLEKYKTQINIIVLTLTLIVVSIYTFASFQLNNTARKQIEVTVKPVFAITDRNQSQWFEIENVGLYTALYTHIDEVDIIKDSIHILFLKTPQYVKASQKAQIQTLFNNAPMPEFVINKPRTCKNKYTTKLHFQSINGEKYYQEITIAMRNDINIVSLGTIHTE